MPARLRSIVAVIALVAVCLLTPIAASAWWVRATVSDTDRFVSTLAPLATEPEVTELVETRTVDRVMERLDQAQPLKRAARSLESADVPPAVATILPMLSETLRERTQELVERIVHRLVTGPRFAEAWETSLSQVHPQLIAALEGDTGDVVETDEDGALTLRLGFLVDAVTLALEDAGVPGASRLTDFDIAVPVADGDNLAAARSGYDLLYGVGRWLPIVALFLAVVGVALARNRATAVRRTAIGTGVALVLFLLAARIGRRLGVEALPSDVQDAAAAMLGLFTSDLRTLLRVLTILTLVVVIATLFWGDQPGPSSRRAAVARTYRKAMDAATSTAWVWPVAAAVGAVCLLVAVMVDVGPGLMVTLLAIAALSGALAYHVSRVRNQEVG